MKPLRLRSLLDPGPLTRQVRGVLRYVRDWRAYNRLLPPGRRLHPRLAEPCLHDRRPTTPFDPHYYYQAVWAQRAILERGPARHVDVGSQILFPALLAARLPVVFVDVRPLQADVDNLTCLEGSVLHLPFEDGSVDSLSSLHVIEHVGLGRYGDPLDPDGTRKACRELARVIAPGGRLYLSAPVGRARTCFNAHRVLDPRALLDDLRPLRLEACAAVDDRGRFLPDAHPSDLAGAHYACGLFCLERQP